MKNLAIAALIAMILSHSPEGLAVLSNEKGNGGDVVRCKPTEKTGVRSKPHWRVLDSIVLQDSRTFALRKFQSSEQASAVILEKLKSTVPLLAQGWEKFAVTANKKIDLERGVVWIGGVPKNLTDENLYVAVPSGCSSKIVQAIVRVDSAPTRFYFDPAIYVEIANDVDELSWLLIHEWLRNYVKDADVIRVLNGYLHSEEFFSATETQVAQTLGSFGLSRHEIGWVASDVRIFESNMEKTLSILEPLLAEAARNVNSEDDQTRDERLRQMESLVDRLFQNRAVISSQLLARYTSARVQYSELSTIAYLERNARRSR